MNEQKTLKGRIQVLVACLPLISYSLALVGAQSRLV